MNEVIERVKVSCTRRNLFAAGLLVLALAVTAGLVMQSVVIAASTASANRDQAIASAQQTSKAFTAVTKEVTPAVVFIKATKQQVMTGNMQQFGDLQGQFPEEMLKRFFGDSLPQMQMPRQPQPMVGQGSGFIISKDGYILTNNHVAGEASKLEVTLSDGRVLSAKLIGTDARTDVAIIKVNADNLPMLPMGDSDKIEVGEWVLAIGSPFGLSGTVTSGIVSAKGRNSMGITDYEDFLQTDAAINPGNSRRSAGQPSGGGDRNQHRHHEPQRWLQRDWVCHSDEYGQRHLRPADQERIGGSWLPGCDDPTADSRIGPVVPGFGHPGCLDRRRHARWPGRQSRLAAW